MKKRLESELMSIAHRILKLKGKEDLNQLHFQAQKLYESLSILKFVEDHTSTIQPKIDVDLIEEKIEEFLDEDSKVENEYLSKLENEIEELRIDLNEIEQKIAHTNSPKTVFFNDLISNDYKEPVFEKIADRVEIEKIEEEIKIEPVNNFEIDKKKTNDNLSNTINISLNDRIGFVKNLFDDNNEDYIRVLSQISTLNDFDEAKDFINNMVKPDYNNWEGKEDFETRFMEIVEKKFE